ncbi:MAG: metalloregulator ArsR/SmtB family transcription factor [Eubacterium sp.]
MLLQEILKILSDTNRLRILNLLNQEELCVCEIEYVLGLSQSNLSKHLSNMSKLEVVEMRRENKFAFYKISSAFIKQYDFIAEVLDLLVEEEPFKTDYQNYKAYKKSDLSCACLSNKRMK